MMKILPVIIIPLFNDVVAFTIAEVGAKGMVMFCYKIFAVNFVSPSRVMLIEFSADEGFSFHTQVEASTTTVAPAPRFYQI